MGTNISTEITAEFEELAALFLWGELPHSGMLRLYELMDSHPALKAEFAEVADFNRLVDGLADTPPGASVEGERPQPVSRFSMQGFLKFAAGLVFALFSLGGYYFLVQNAGEPADRVTLTLGKCLAGGAPAQAGLEVQGSLLESASNSVCDIQFKDGGNTLLRLYPDSRVTYAKRKGSLFLNLEQGRILLDSSRRGKNQYLKVYSSGNLVRFMGTKVVLGVGAGGKLNLKVLEGRVQVSRGVLPDELKPSGSLHGKKLAAFFDGLEAGKTFVLEEKMQAAFQAKGSDFDSQPLSVEELDYVSRQFQHLGRLSPDDFDEPDVIRKKTPKRRQARILKEAVAPDAAAIRQRIHFSDGRVEEGLIYEKGEFYILITEAGLKKIPIDSVKEVEILGD